MSAERNSWSTPIQQLHSLNNNQLFIKRDDFIPMPTTGENFGHSIVEAMLLGRVVVISDQTPWTKVNQFGGYAIPLENEQEYTLALQELCDMDQTEYERRCVDVRNYIMNALNIDQTVREYIHVFS